MSRIKIPIDRRELQRLYIGEKYSPYTLAKVLNCSFATIRNRLKEYRIPLRTHSQANIRYPRQPFRGSNEEKAYILGFRVGDLNVYRPSLTGSTLVARCHTTQESQVAVFQQCFSPYGRVSVSGKHGHYHLNAFLDAASFEFLLNKHEIPRWLQGTSRWAFIAGYNDAEGNWLLNQGRARMKIDSYDSHVLRWIARQLHSKEIPSRLRRIGIAGQLRTDGTRFRKDLWRLNVNRAEALEQLTAKLFPFTKHAKRRADMLVCLENVRRRLYQYAV